MKHIKLFEQFLNESEMFNTWSEVIGYEFNKVKQAYQELNKNNQVVFDKKENVSYGFRKGDKNAHWKYYHDDFKLYHSEREKDVLGLINFKNMVSKDHPWTK